MNRSLLLLVPALALFLMACPQKHTTSGETPDKPNPNGYVYGSQGNSGSVSVGSNTTGSSSESIDNGNVTTPDTIHAVGSKPDSVRTRLVVSFISQGGGIDLAAQANLDKWLSKHADVKYAQNQWGREGEVDYCFITLGANADAQKKTIDEIKALVGTNAKVLVKENKVCTHKHELGVITMPVVEEAPDAPKVDSTNIARVVVSFISKGEGIDIAGKDALDKWLSERNAVYEVKNWGREGETNYCFFLTGMQTRQQDIFVRDLRTFLGENELVLVEEWGKCDKRK
jgi:hypothetical protein